MRVTTIVASLLVAGCAGVSTVPLKLDSGQLLIDGGVAYELPRGLVPIQVFADTKGIGLTLEPAAFVSDSRVGILIARLQPSASNNENFKLAVSPSTGFLTSVSSDSTAQILAIFEELAKTAGRLALENERATALKEKVTFLQDSFDPLSPPDVERINVSINAAVQKASQAFASGGRGIRLGARPQVTLSVHHADGSPSQAEPPFSLDGCRIGICARAMTSRVIRVSLDGSSVLGQPVLIPSHEVVPVPVPQVILADQKIAITIENGILKQYDVTRASELLGLAKIPGAVVGGVVTGITQGLSDAVAITTKQTEAVDAQKALLDAKKSAVTSVKLENETASATVGAYAARIQTIYVHSEVLAEAIRALKAPSATTPPPRPSVVDGDLITPRS